MIDLKVEREELLDSSKLGGWQRFMLFIRLQKYVLKYWDKLLLRLFCTQAAGILILIPPILTRDLIDITLPQGDVPGLLTAVCICIAAYIVMHLLLFIGGIPTNFQTALVVPESILGNFTIARIMLDLKMKYFNHLHALSVKIYKSRPIGEHIFRGTLDLDDASLLASESIPLIASTTQRIIMTSLLLATIDQKILMVIPFYLLFFFMFKNLFITLFRKMDRSFRQEFSQLEAVTREILASNKVVKGYGRERTARRWYGAQVGRMLRMNYRKELFMFFDQHFTSNVFSVVLPLLSIFFGLKVLVGDMTLGEYLAAATLMYLLLTPLQEIISLYQLVRQRLVPVERMLETLGLETDVPELPDARELTRLEGKVELKDVSFSYKPGTPVLKNINLVAHPGEKVALVGPIGAGKSTLMQLILRLSDPEHGQVLVDGCDVRSVTKDSLRRNISIVIQQINTFTETIRKNILFGKPLANDEELTLAARLAHVDEFVDQLPRTYDTELSEGGSLSGGQKQRICIARALIRQPSILLLDEATSALDPVTEKYVSDAIDREYEGRTRIVVAHNLLSARSADRIYVMEAGEIVACGTHKELMESSEKYRRLWTANSDSAPGAA